MAAEVGHRGDKSRRGPCRRGPPGLGDRRCGIGRRGLPRCQPGGHLLGWPPGGVRHPKRPVRPPPPPAARLLRPNPGGRHPLAGHQRHLRHPDAHRPGNPPGRQHGDSLRRGHHHDDAAEPLPHPLRPAPLPLNVPFRQTLHPPSLRPLDPYPGGALSHLDPGPGDGRRHRGGAGLRPGELNPGGIRSRVRRLLPAEHGNGPSPGGGLPAARRHCVARDPHRHRGGRP